MLSGGGGREARTVGNPNPLAPHTFTEDGLKNLKGFKKQRRTGTSIRYQYVSPDGLVFSTIQAKDVGGGWMQTEEAQTQESIHRTNTTSHLYY